MLIAGSALALVLVHSVVYIARLGLVAGPGDAMRVDHAYWLPFVAATAGLTLASGLVSRRHAIRSTLRIDESPFVHRMARLWVSIAAVSVLGFVALENLEGFVATGRAVGLTPLGWVVDPPVALSIAAVLAVLAAGVVRLVTAGPDTYAATLVRSYRQLVQDGTYSASFTQSGWARDFVSSVLGVPLARRGSSGSVSILECGSGTGVWLAEVAAMVAERPGRLYGFDLSPEMVDAARERLAAGGISAVVRTGDILDARSYEFDGTARHDVVYGYDVIQQLPRNLQEVAVATMFDHVAPGGWLVIFDHDSRSRYGRVMGAKEWLRRYFDVPLVPRFYIHARYPDLRAMLRLLAVRGGVDATIVVEAEARKRALIARRAPDATDGAAVDAVHDEGPPTA